MSVIPATRSLPDGTKQGYSNVEARKIELHIGETVITADSASVENWLGSPGPVEIVLSGNVRVKTVLDPTPIQ